MLKPYTNRVEDAVEIAARKLAHELTPRRQRIYTKIAQRSIGMVVLMAFALDSSAVTNIRGGEVGLGVSGMANKGAAGLRFAYADKKGGETELTFIAAHLAAMEGELDRRNEDWANIVRGLVLTPINSTTNANQKRDTDGRTREGEEESEALIKSESNNEESIFSPTSHLFLAGDLNYRTSLLKPASDDHKDAFPQPHHLPGSDQHYATYYQRDQLNQERMAGRTCHGLTEFAVKFPPTYKYDSYDLTTSTHSIRDDEDITGWWAWAEHRWPSWTDRILYLDLPSWLADKYEEGKKPRIELGRYVALPLFETSDHRAVALSCRVPLLPIPEPTEEERERLKSDVRITPPFDRAPDWRAKRTLARKEELMAGYSMFFTSTWEGWLIVIGTLAGFVGGYFLLKAGFDV